MKYFQIAILLFILSFDVFAIAEDYLEKKQLTDKQVIDVYKNLSDNEIEMDDEFNKIVQSITNLDTWKSINKENAHNVEIILQKEINEISKKMTDNVKFAKKFQEDESKIWLKYFLEKLYNSLSDYVTQLNKDWNTEYLDLVQHYNTLQMEVESFKESVNNFNFALNSLKNTKYRSKVIKDVYKQNLMGIPTTFVILGMREWQPSMETKDQCYKIIKENAKHFIGEQLAPTALIFSEQTVKKAKVTVDIIKRYRGGVIEPFETDPIAFQHYKVSYVIQKYRCYPKLDSFEGNNHNNLNIKGNLADNEPIFYHLTNEKLHELIADKTLPKKHLDKIKLMLDESDKKNKSSINNIMSFNYQYMDQIQKIEKPYNDNVENINSLLNKIVNIINKHKNETSINNNISISEFQSNVRKLVHLDDTLIEKENEYRKPINEMLNQIQKKSFQSLSDKAKEY
ncbi:secreted protein [Candidatus Magnetomorum sp. HK-1]|nr:secreted protein [Candidatus Magnetomorum sp. HK-1]